MKKMEKKKRKLNKKKRYFRIFSRFFIFFSFIFLIIFALKNSNFFDVTSITIEGNKNVSSAKIKKVTDLHKGSKLFVVSKKDRIKKLKRVPYIEDAKISYSLRGRVKIKVKERLPYYQIDANDYLLVDDNFRILENSDKKRDNLVNLSGFNVENPQAGNYILTNKEDQEKRNLLLELRNDEYSLRGNIRDIELLDSISTFTTVDGIKIEFGSYSNIEYKLKMLSLILKDISTTNKNAVLIQMEKGDSPVLITDGEKDSKSDKEENKNLKKEENKDKSYREINQD
ncbi:cell division protein FtsQ/DivIB [Peptoniphilus sp. DNF00840]|uniref:cell division protein FtsQ/DivIB n=1 Tax=Peptoniphilus sp. DNF00840 TaxID=1477000 RepID=UPI000784A047|nr:FtsQ-type POTRA domain-containing protein [Peptoniphilus sp. DNF00840]KXB71839.1 POTRA domain protein, FtsQ-type [Peptoniphilus sp. DNF00840]